MISGHAQDPQGRKMSKSLGNIIEPQAMIEKFSADALRFWAAGSTLGDDLPFMEKDLVTGQKFVTKLWNASKFALSHLDDFDATAQVELTDEFDRWMMRKLDETITTSTSCFEEYEYSKTKAAVEQFFWHTLCDYYVEIVKDRLYNPDRRGSANRRSAQYVIYHSLLAVLKMIAPIMPHITEEIYQSFFASREAKKSIHLSFWPKCSSITSSDAAEYGIDIIDAVRKFKSEKQVSMKQELQKLVLLGEKVEERVRNIETDLKAVLNVKEIVFSGETSVETERFNIKVGVEL